MVADDSTAEDIEGILKELSEYIEHEVYGLPFRRWESDRPPIETGAGRSPKK